jgi:RHS repeat-associated protein
MPRNGYNLDPNQYLSTYYIRDASGNVMATYQKTWSNGHINAKDHPIYGSSRIGVDENEVAIIPQTTQNLNSTNFVTGSKIYELSNHLGNVMQTITDHKIAYTYSGNLRYGAEVTSMNDYYPFGMLMPNRHENSSQYRYGFNGKEKDDETKGQGAQYDYGFRIYDPRIARFLSVDPLTKSYPWYTPYQFAGNKPIWATDLDGLEEYYYMDYIIGTTGNVMISTYTKGVLEDGGSTTYVLRLIDLSKEGVVITEKVVPRKQFYEAADYLNVKGRLESRSLNELIYDEFGNEDSPKRLSEKTDIPATDQGQDMFDQVFGGNFGVQKGTGGSSDNDGENRSKDDPLIGTGGYDSPEGKKEVPYSYEDQTDTINEGKSILVTKRKFKFENGEFNYSHEFYGIDLETGDTTYKFTDSNKE